MNLDIRPTPHDHPQVQAPIAEHPDNAAASVSMEKRWTQG
jgi:hypothetical protein